MFGPEFDFNSLASQLPEPYRAAKSSNSDESLNPQPPDNPDQSQPAGNRDGKQGPRIPHSAVEKVPHHKERSPNQNTAGNPADHGKRYVVGLGPGGHLCFRDARQGPDLTPARTGRTHLLIEVDQRF